MHPRKAIGDATAAPAASRQRTTYNGMHPRMAAAGIGHQATPRPWRALSI